MQLGVAENNNIAILPTVGSREKFKIIIFSKIHKIKNLLYLDYTIIHLQDF